MLALVPSSRSVAKATWMVRRLPPPRCVSCSKGSGTTVPGRKRSSSPSSLVSEQTHTEPSGAATVPGPLAWNQSPTGTCVSPPAGSMRSKEGEQSCAWKVLPRPSTADMTGVGSAACSLPPSPGNADSL